jgi:hypothetical protein
MTLCRLVPLALLAVLHLPAGTILEVTHQTAIHLYTGDALRFTISASNFELDAATLGVSIYPTALKFTFVSAPLDGAGQFLADLESGDGETSVAAADPLSFVDSWLSGSKYAGEVSSLNGYFSFSEAESRQLFAGSGAVLKLLNTGPEMAVGLPPYTLRQDLNATLSNDRLSVGALPGSVGYVDPPPAVPEPRPCVALLGGGAALWLLSAARRRRHGRARTPAGPGRIE